MTSQQTNEANQHGSTNQHTGGGGGATPPAGLPHRLPRLNHVVPQHPPTSHWLSGLKVSVCLVACLVLAIKGGLTGAGPLATWRGAVDDGFAFKAVAMTEAEAFAAIALAVAADGKIRQDEASALRKVLEHRRLFREMSEQDMGNLSIELMQSLKVMACADLWIVPC